MIYVLHSRLVGSKGNAIAELCNYRIVILSMARFDCLALVGQNLLPEKKIMSRLGHIKVSDMILKSWLQKTEITDFIVTKILICNLYIII